MNGAWGHLDKFLELRRRQRPLLSLTLVLSGVRRFSSSSSIIQLNNRNGWVGICRRCWTNCTIPYVSTEIAWLVATWQLFQPCLKTVDGNFDFENTLLDLYRAQYDKKQETPLEGQKGDCNLHWHHVGYVFSCRSAIIKSKVWGMIKSGQNYSKLYCMKQKFPSRSSSMWFLLCTSTTKSPTCVLSLKAAPGTRIIKCRENLSVASYRHPSQDSVLSITNQTKLGMRKQLIGT